MEAYYQYLNTLINNNKLEYRDFSPINWVNPYNSMHLLPERARLVEIVGNNFKFKKTKPYHNQISKGCEICGQGAWSCLFITGKCNASCFYCPANQQHDATPSSQAIDFETPESYAEYVKHFNFKGVSFSGGEPLLYFDRTLEYLKSMRKLNGDDLYIWMYTNGILGDTAKFMKLNDAGVDEVRFDIGATGYKMENVIKAKGIIKNLTIEIPAVPEDTKKLISLLPQMIKAGVTNLNLHQLRLTKHNASRLLKRNYTYLPSERPVVLESEIAALKIMAYAVAHGLEIGINFCSFDYKHRFQKAGYRRQISSAFVEGDEYLTENGYLRRYNHERLNYLSVSLTDKQSPRMADAGKYAVGNKNYFIMKSEIRPPVVLNIGSKAEIDQLLSGEPSDIPEDDQLFEIWKCEYIESGLRNYLL